MNPNQIKRRENLGLATLVIGVLVCLASLAFFLINPMAALAGFSMGLVVTIGGGLVLGSIPDLVHTPDESY